MKLSPRYKKSLSAIFLVALPLLLAFAPLSQVVLAMESGLSLSLIAQADRKAEADRLLNQGSQLFGVSKYREAFAAWEQALQIYREIKDRNGEGRALNNLGNAYDSLGQYQKAIDFYQQSLAILNQIGDHSGEAYSLNNLGEAYYHLQEYSQALEYFQKSVEISKRIQRPEQNIIALNNELETLQKIDSLTKEQEQRLADLTNQEREGNAQFNAFLNSPVVEKRIEELTLNEESQNIKVTEYNQLRVKLAQFKNAALFYPFITDDRLELILITTTSSPIRIAINLRLTDLNKDILAFRKSLSDPTSITVQADAQKFYNYLIKPFESELKQAKIETIIYAPDGQLRYIPLAALYDGKQWLVEKYRINNITSRSLTNFAPQNYSQPRILAAASTNSQIIKVGDRSIFFNALPATKTEVEAIASLLPKTTTLIDRKFSKAEVLSKIQSYTILHLATHGYFSVEQPEESFIVFGDGDKASLKEIKGWTLDNIRLVVLSACETAVGGKVGNGIQILGLGYQTQIAGAGAVIASLWKVDDVGTQTLMQKLYESLKQKDTSSSEALRQAQIGMIRSDQTVSSSDRAAGIKIVGTVPKFPDGKLSHPYYWSAFILIGNGL